MPGVRGPNPGEAIVIAYFEDMDTAEAVRAQVAEDFPDARVLLEEKPQQDWSNEWKALIKSVQVGRLWVGPPWEADAAPRTRCAWSSSRRWRSAPETTPPPRCAWRRWMSTWPAPGRERAGRGHRHGRARHRREEAGRGPRGGHGQRRDLGGAGAGERRVNHTPDVELSGKELTQVKGPFELVVANILANTLIALAPLIAPKVKDRLHPGGRARAPEGRGGGRLHAPTGSSPRRGRPGRVGAARLPPLRRLRWPPRAAASCAGRAGTAAPCRRCPRR